LRATEERTDLMIRWSEGLWHWSTQQHTGETHSFLLIPAPKEFYKITPKNIQKGSPDADGVAS